MGRQILKLCFRKLLTSGWGIEALLFAPSAMVDGDGGEGTKRLGTEYLKIRVRSRITTDGGKGKLAA